MMLSFLLQILIFLAILFKPLSGKILYLLTQLMFPFCDVLRDDYDVRFRVGHFLVASLTFHIN